MRNLLLIQLLLLCLFPFEISSQCSPEIMQQLKEEREMLLSQLANTVDAKVVRETYNPKKGVACLSLAAMSDEDFRILAGSFDYSELKKGLPKDVNCVVLSSKTIEQNAKIMQVCVKRIWNTEGNTLRNMQKNEIDSRLEKAKRLLEMQKQQLEELEKQQRYLNVDALTEALNLLVAEIDVPVFFEHLVDDAFEKLKSKGIEFASKYFEVEDYAPSENENAEFVREVLEPVDKCLSVGKIPLGKFLKYWEALKKTPSGGKIFGNGAAKLRIYFMQKDLELEIEKTKKRIEELNRIKESNCSRHNYKEEQQYLF